MLKILDIGKNFPSQTVLRNINLEIAQGEFFSLLGPSGCGKSTLLRILAGLETPSTGQIWLGGNRIDQVAPQARPFNMIFQKYALFPHLTVNENVAFGLKIKQISATEVKTRVSDTLKLVGLSDFGERKPETLSGGQAQRVALARAIVNRPQVLLLDEPLSALDQKMRLHMQVELRNLQKNLGITFIFVTHDQEEALTLSDRIAVMNHGVVEQVSTPEELYNSPQTPFVTEFVGAMGEIDGELDGAENGLMKFRSKSGQIIWGRNLRGANKGAARAYIRPEKISLRELDIGSTSNKIAASVRQTIFKGHHREVYFDVGDSILFKAFLDAHDRPLKSGERVDLFFAPKDTLIF